MKNSSFRNSESQHNPHQQNFRLRRKKSKGKLLIMFVILVVTMLILTYLLRKEGLTWHDVIETSESEQYETAPTKYDDDSGYTTTTTTTTTYKRENTRTSKQDKTTTTTTTSTSSNTTTSSTTNYDTNYTQTITKISQPESVGNNQIVEHIAYKLSYNDKHEQADWVYYLLTKKRINGGEDRTGDFCEDTSVDLKTALKSDYSNSGYDRGHLCPSADVRDNLEAQKETFYMSNMSPQLPDFNRGIWKDLEEQTRRWTLKHDSIYVVTGPILKGNLKKIGTTTRVSIPKYFYKILYSPQSGGHIIAFLLPNKDCKGKTPNDFIVSVDSVESFSGLNFFPKIKSEKSLEKKIGDIGWWQN